MTFKWTTEHEIRLTKDDFSEIVNVYMCDNEENFDDPYGEDFEDLIKEAISHWSIIYIEDKDYYALTDDVINQIALVIKNNYKALKED